MQKVNNYEHVQKVNYAYVWKVNNYERVQKVNNYADIVLAADVHM